MCSTLHVETYSCLSAGGRRVSKATKARQIKKAVVEAEKAARTQDRCQSFFRWLVITPCSQKFIIVFVKIYTYDEAKPKQRVLRDVKYPILKSDFTDVETLLVVLRKVYGCQLAAEEKPAISYRMYPSAPARSLETSNHYATFIADLRKYETKAVPQGVPIYVWLASPVCALSYTCL